MEVAARRRADRRGWLPAVVVALSRRAQAGDFDAVLELLDAVQLPRRTRCCASIRTNSPAASASG
jgi:hypothetical protein